MTQILEHLFSNLSLWSFKPVSFIWRGDLTGGYLRYRFEGLIFGEAYFRNFMVYDERSFLNLGNTTVPSRRVGENPWNEDSAPCFKIWRMGLIWRIFSHDLRNSLLDLSRRLQFNASEEMSFGVRGLRSEFSRPEFTRHLHQTVVFPRFKNDSSSDCSPLIQDKYDSRVFKMRY